MARVKLQDKLALPIFLWIVALAFFAFCFLTAFFDMKSIGL